MYDMPEGRRLVQPRILAQSVIAKRTVVSLESEGLQATDVDEGESGTELDDLARFYHNFWREFIGDLKLDDPDQPPPNPTKIGNVYFKMPLSDIWITLYFLQKESRIGAYLTASIGDRPHFRAAFGKQGSD